MAIHCTRMRGLRLLADR